MKVAFVGLGKLGLPCALAIENKGHTVFGVDPGEQTRQVIWTRKLAYVEQGAQELLTDSKIKLVDFEYVVREADLIFVAVQTPHNPQYEGVAPIPSTRADFDYRYLCQAIESLCQEIRKQGVEKDVAIISTVLPGTMQEHVRPIIARYGVKDKFHLVYEPLYIAMSTTINDYLHPEFVLLGVDSEATAEKVIEFYKTIHNAPVFKTTVENAELIKVLYNTYISTKIAFANVVMEICHKTPNTNCDSVIDALSLATERLLSPKYLRGGMGDGGACHPRDNIALSWLSRKLDLSHDVFEDIMMTREHQTEWLVDLILDAMDNNEGLPVFLLGWSFKQNTNIVVGSPARLLSYFLTEQHVAHDAYDPFVPEKTANKPDKQGIYFVSTRHDCWRDFAFPAGSTVIDPFRYLGGNETIKKCKYVPLGVGMKKN